MEAEKDQSTVMMEAFVATITGILEKQDAVKAKQHEDKKELDILFQRTALARTLIASGVPVSEVAEKAKALLVELSKPYGE